MFTTDELTAAGQRAADRPVEAMPNVAEIQQEAVRRRQSLRLVTGACAATVVLVAVGGAMLLRTGGGGDVQVLTATPVAEEDDGVTDLAGRQASTEPVADSRRSESSESGERDDGTTRSDADAADRSDGATGIITGDEAAVYERTGDSAPADGRDTERADRPGDRASAADADRDTEDKPAADGREDGEGAEGEANRENDIDRDDDRDDEDDEDDADEVDLDDIELDDLWAIDPDRRREWLEDKFDDWEDTGDGIIDWLPDLRGISVELSSNDQAKRRAAKAQASADATVELNGRIIWIDRPSRDGRSTVVSALLGDGRFIEASGRADQEQVMIDLVGNFGDRFPFPIPSDDWGIDPDPPEVLDRLEDLDELEDLDRFLERDLDGDWEWREPIRPEVAPNDRRSG